MSKAQKWYTVYVKEGTNVKKLLISTTIGLAAAALMISPALAATITKVITPSDLKINQKAWYFYDDSTNLPSTNPVPGSYEFSHAQAYKQGFGKHNSGSLKFQTTGQQRWTIATLHYSGRVLSKFKSISFATFEPTTTTANSKAIFLTFDVDFDGPGAQNTNNNNYQGRLIYVPSKNGTVKQNTWQVWDATEPNAKWTWSHLDQNGNKWPDGNTNPYRTWSDIIAQFPHATISSGGNHKGQLLLRAGEPYPDGFTGYLDYVSITGSKQAVTYNFEPSN